MSRSVPKGSELHKRLIDLFELDHKIRAKFLVQSIYVESYMGEVISKYFTSDGKKLELFYFLVIKELSFDKKIRILREILNRNPIFVKKYPKLEQLERVKKFRNKLAHALPNTDEDYLMNRKNDSIQLELHQSGGKKIVEFTIKQMDEELNHASDITEDLVSLITDLGELDQNDSK